jgi:hypothetical protein
MLGGEERQFLYFAAREFYSGTGEIVDAGAFLGASALALAAGLRDNPRVRDKSRRISSYDVFEFDDFYRDHVPGARLRRGDDTLPLFHEFVGGFGDQIAAIKGDICRQSWPGRDVEILFVDFTQRWQHHEFVVRTFYPHLIPGHSLLIHQDYVYTLCYWLHVFMEYYRESFELVSPLVLNGTAAWLCRKPLPGEALEIPLNERLSFADLLRLFDRSLARYSGTAAGLLRCARGRMLLHALGPHPALEYVATLEEEYAGDVGLRPHVALLRDEIGRWPTESPYHGFYRV